MLRRFFSCRIKIEIIKFEKTNVYPIHEKPLHSKISASGTGNMEQHITYSLVTHDVIGNLQVSQTHWIDELQIRWDLTQKEGGLHTWVLEKQRAAAELELFSLPLGFHSSRRWDIGCRVRKVSKNLTSCETCEEQFWSAYCNNGLNVMGYPPCSFLFKAYSIGQY